MAATGQKFGHRLEIFGVVQGVGFRPTVFKVAQQLEANGFVRNLGALVEVVIDCDPDKFIALLKEALPPLASIRKIETGSWEESIPPGFFILQSTTGSRDSALPPDTAVCKDCLSEAFDPTDRRYLYPFTNCTNCGARYSVISGLPYDRPKTAMSPFELCSACLSEYIDPSNRRFHAQTISCSDDGPSLALHGGNGKRLEVEHPMQEFAQMVEGGGLFGMKGWSGVHIMCRLQDIGKLRKWYGRPNKPFAIMARNIAAARELAEVDAYALELLEGKEKPIVLLQKKRNLNKNLNKINNDVRWLEEVAPGLGHVGIYLPYTMLQHLFFHYSGLDAVVLTSANLMGEPMLIKNPKVLELGLDGYLLHDRSIVARVDDSLVKPQFGNSLFIRRSRGYVPSPFEVLHDSSVLSLGAERNGCVALSRNGRLFPSQYIGNTSHYHVLRFLEETVDHLRNLLGLHDLDAIAVDMHPQYSTTRLGKKRAKELGVQLFEVQHHWAHAASLILDAGLEEPMVCLSLDGSGYGDDGNIWGGEVLVADLEGYKRVGQLEYLPMPGGDRAVKEPSRMLFSIHKMLGLGSFGLFDLEKERILADSLGNAPLTSSAGRVLDALAVFLGVCNSTTYDGEPAMKLERLMDHNGPLLGLSVDINNGILSTTKLFAQLFEHYPNPTCLDETTCSLAATSFTRALGYGLADMAIQAARDNDITHIGLTGGVAYNTPLARFIRQRIEEKGSGDLTFHTHNSIPPGDGGVCVGQNIIAGLMMAH